MPKKRIFEDFLKSANEELKRGNIGLTIEQRGSRLAIRGIFPPKPNDSHLEPHQQRISIAPASLDGLNYAVAKAKEIGGKLASEHFDWMNYLPDSGEEHKPINQVLADFRRHWFENRDDLQSEQTWKGEYLVVFKHLPQSERLNEETLREIILKTPANSRNRRRYVLACAKLADFVGLQHSLRDLMGNYGNNPINPRDLPEDPTIAKIRESIKNTSWQWVYGMLTCYGLRNHEVFFCDLEDYPICYVNRGKTHERYVWPLYPEWADNWGLQSMNKPNCTGSINSDYGSRVTHAFSREKVPFAPYNLRHCWARRSIDFGLDISLAASQMGHSVKVHTDIYHLWITRKTHEKAMRLIFENPNRPISP